MPVGQVNTALGSLNLVFWHPRPDSVAEEGCGPCTRGGPSALRMSFRMSRFKEEAPKAVSSRTTVHAGSVVSVGGLHAQTGVSHLAAFPRRVPSPLDERRTRASCPRLAQSEEWRPLFHS